MQAEASNGERDSSTGGGSDDDVKELQRLKRDELVAEGIYVDGNKKGNDFDFENGEKDSGYQGNRPEVNDIQDNAIIPGSLEDRLTGEENEGNASSNCKSHSSNCKRRVEMDDQGI